MTTKEKPRDDADWVVIDSSKGNQFECLRCGRTYLPTYPCPVDIVIAIGSAFSKMHAMCSRRADRHGRKIQTSATSEDRALRMSAKFHQHFVAMGASDPAVSAVFWELLVPYYESPDRHYHTLGHVNRLFVTAEELRWTLDPCSMIALWFHDAIYDAARKDNEDRSSDLCIGACALMGVDRGVVRAAAHVIESTKYHEVTGVGDAVPSVLDLDLTPLGADDKTFDEDCLAIRKEYGHVPDVDYKVGRTEILRRFLARASIFATKDCKEKFEGQARTNIERELVRLAT